jgi:hypothetical protein
MGPARASQKKHGLAITAGCTNNESRKSQDRKRLKEAKEVYKN